MSTSTYTTAAARTFARTATHLAGVVVSALAETLVAIGVSSQRVSRVYRYEAAISAWIGERSLDKVRITLTEPGRVERPGYSFDIDYTAWDLSRSSAISSHGSAARSRRSRGSDRGPTSR